MIPYVMGGIGYTGLMLVTLLFVLRFLRPLEAREATDLASQIARAPSLSPDGVPAGVEG